MELQDRILVSPLKSIPGRCHCLIVSNAAVPEQQHLSTARAAQCLTTEPLHSSSTAGADMDCVEAAKSAAITALRTRLRAQQCGTAQPGVQPDEQHWLPAAPQHSSPHTFGNTAALGAPAATVASEAQLDGMHAPAVHAQLNSFSTDGWEHSVLTEPSSPGCVGPAALPGSLPPSAQHSKPLDALPPSAQHSMSPHVTVASAWHSMPLNAALAPAQQPADTEQARIDRMLETLLPQLTDSLGDHTSHVIHTLRLEAYVAGHSSTDFLSAVIEEVGRTVGVPSREQDGYILCQRLQQLPEYQALVSQPPPASQHDLNPAQHMGVMSYGANNVHLGGGAGHLFADTLLLGGSNTSAAWTTGLAMTAACNNGYIHGRTVLWDGADAVNARKNRDDARLMPPPPPRTPASRRKPRKSQLSPAAMANTQRAAAPASPGSKAEPGAKGMPSRKRAAQDQDAGQQKPCKKQVPAVGFLSSAKGGRMCLDLSEAGDGLRQPGMPQSVTNTTGLPQAAGARSAGAAGLEGQGHTAAPPALSGALPPFLLSHRGPILFL